MISLNKVLELLGIIKQLRSCETLAEIAKQEDNLQKASVGLLFKKELNTLRKIVADINKFLTVSNKIEKHELLEEIVALIEGTEYYLNPKLAGVIYGLIYLVIFVVLASITITPFQAIIIVFSLGVLSYFSMGFIYTLYIFPFYNKSLSLILKEEELLIASLNIKHIPNNYIVGPPIRPGKHNLFVGRELIFRRILGLLENQFDKPSIILHGQRRMGKTSILYHIEDYFKNSSTKFNIITILADMQSVTQVKNVGEFLYNVCRIIRNTVSKYGVMVELPTVESFEKRPFLRFDEFLDELTKLISPYSYIFLMLDEFEEIEYKIKQGIFQKNLLEEFRSIMQHREKLFLIFSGSHALNEMCKDFWSPFFHIAEPIKIGYLSDEAATRLITTPWENFPISYELAAVKEIMRITGNQPMLIQVICRTLIDQMNEQLDSQQILPYKFPKLRIQNVHEAIGQSLTGSYYFEAMWNSLEKSEQMLLTNMARGKEETSQNIDDDVVHSLQKKELLTNDNKYRIPLLHDWIRENK